MNALESTNPTPAIIPGQKLVATRDNKSHTIRSVKIIEGTSVAANTFPEIKVKKDIRRNHSG